MTKITDMKELLEIDMYTYLNNYNINMSGKLNKDRMNLACIPELAGSILLRGVFCQ